MTRPALTGALRAALPCLAILLTISLAIPAAAATLQISGPPGATVRINDHEVGTLPLARPLDLPRGTYAVTCEARGYQDFDSVVVLGEDDAWSHLHVRPVRLSRSTAVRSNLLFAGLGQHYLGQGWRGWLYTAVEAGGLLTALSGEIQRGDHRDDFRLYQAQYDVAISPGDILRYRELTAKAYADMQDASDLRDSGLLVAAGAIAVSMLDALLLFPGADIGPGPVPPLQGSAAPPTPVDQFALHAGWRVAF
jgi:TM2 domain-containing membrane protein YozV